MAERLELGSKAEHLLDLALRAAATGGPQIPPASPPARPDTSTMQMPFERPHRACSRPNIFWTAHSMRRHMATSQRQRGLQLTPRSTSRSCPASRVQPDVRQRDRRWVFPEYRLVGRVFELRGLPQAPLVAAVKADEVKALDLIKKGEGGFLDCSCFVKAPRALCQSS
jgi:hypothetical protein